MTHTHITAVRIDGEIAIRVYRDGALIVEQPINLSNAMLVAADLTAFARDAVQKIKSQAKAGTP